MKNLKKEYYEIYSEFIKNDKYNALASDIHHGIKKSEHINRVGYLSFLLSKVGKLDTNTITRGALMHDFFTEEDISGIKRGKEMYKTHPTIALENSKKYFELNKIEENIIKTHMFPVTRELPSYKESYIVSIADKVVSVYEFLRFNSKAYVYFFVLFLTVK